jgi:hypothetical protein
MVSLLPKMIAKQLLVLQLLLSNTDTDTTTAFQMNKIISAFKNFKCIKPNPSSKAKNANSNGASGSQGISNTSNGEISLDSNKNISRKTVKTETVTRSTTILLNPRCKDSAVIWTLQPKTIDELKEIEDFVKDHFDTWLAIHGKKDKKDSSILKHTMSRMSEMIIDPKSK